MNLHYISTRGAKEKVTASQAIIAGIAPDEGLYVPEALPQLDIPLEKLLSLSYRDMAYEILKLFLTDFTEEELRYCIDSAYDDKFDTPLIAPLRSAADTNFLELFHGRTLAFKDMALSILPYFMKVSAQKLGIQQKIVILTATSGDTGKAALEGFAEVPGIDIMVFYPNDGVSQVQKLQMVTQEGENTCVIGIHGNFDDAQTGVKQIFTDLGFSKELSDKGCMLSSANSINIGRLVPQIVYYFYAYAQLVQKGAISIGQPINFTVPTGNFGNILAGYYAKHMGAPIDKLICASNSNKVLYDYFQTGVYDRNREFLLTSSPSMDILISSNLERYLYDVVKDAQTVKALMDDLKTLGRYEMETGLFQKNGVILGTWSGEEETFDAIRRVYAQGYVMDPHTAVAYHAYEKYRETHPEDGNVNVIVSTASPYKFADAVLTAIQGHPVMGIDLSAQLEALSSVSGTEIPGQIRDIARKEIVHQMVCHKQDMKEQVHRFIAR